MYIKDLEDVFLLKDLIPLGRGVLRIPLSHLISATRGSHAVHTRFVLKRIVMRLPHNAQDSSTETFLL
jgi:hypothetical protein